jgi:hypothetical protein
VLIASIVPKNKLISKFRKIIINNILRPFSFENNERILNY